MKDMSDDGEGICEANPKLGETLMKTNFGLNLELMCGRM
jgi:hypothetical protein